MLLIKDEGNFKSEVIAYFFYMTHIFHTSSLPHPFSPSFLTAARAEDGQDDAETGGATSHHARDVHQLPAHIIEQQQAEDVGDDFHDGHQLKVDVDTPTQIARVETQSVEHQRTYHPVEGKGQSKLESSWLDFQPCYTKRYVIFLNINTTNFST